MTHIGLSYAEAPNLPGQLTMSCSKPLFSILLTCLYLLSTIISTNSWNISYEILPFIRVYNNGTVERLTGTQVVPTSVDPKTGVQSRDVKIPSVVPRAQGNIISARLFLPKNVTSRHKLPLLVYFHGGAFCTGSAFAPEYHNHLISLVAKANIVALSINYRLAPENPLPIGYEDSWNTLKWIFSRRNKSWITKFINFKHVYLGGDSYGGNIAHNVAIRAGFENSNGVKIAGMFLNCPHFWGKKPIGHENDNIMGKSTMESIWIHAYPNSTGFDDPLVNPGMDRKLKKLSGKRVLVYVAEKDILKYRGLYYAKVLRKSEWDGDVEVVEAMGEEHVFNIRFPTKPKSLIMLKQLACFLNGGKVDQSRL